MFRKAVNRPKMELPLETGGAIEAGTSLWVAEPDRPIVGNSAARWARAFCCATLRAAIAAWISGLAARAF